MQPPSAPGSNHPWGNPPPPWGQKPPTPRVDLLWQTHPGKVMYCLDFLRLMGQSTKPLLYGGLNPGTNTATPMASGADLDAPRTPSSAQNLVCVLSPE